MTEDLIEMPKEIVAKNHNIELRVDAVFVDCVRDRTVEFRSLVPMETKQCDQHCRSLHIVLWLHDSAGFVAKRLHCDGEHKSMVDKVEDGLNTM